MRRWLRKQIVFLLALFVLLNVNAFLKAKNTTIDDFKNLKEDILTVYKNEGKEGLRGFLNTNKNKIDRTFIIDFADTCFEDGIGRWQTITKIILDERQDLFDSSKRLPKDIIEVYQSKGKKGLRKYAKANKNKITLKYINDFVKAGLQERKKEWLHIALALAKEKKDKMVMHRVYISLGYLNHIERKRKSSVFYREKELVEKIIAIYKDKKETGLRQFVRDNEKKITYRLIKGFCEYGAARRNDEILEIARIMAKETKNQKAIADIYYLIGINTISYDDDYRDEIIAANEKLESDKTKKLIRKIVKVYRSKKEKGLRKFVRKNAKKIDHPFIIYFMEEGHKLNLNKKTAKKKNKKKKSFFKSVLSNAKKVFVPKVAKAEAKVKQTIDDIEKAKKAFEMVKNVIENPEAFIETLKQEYFNEYFGFLSLMAKNFRNPMIDWMQMGRIIADERNDDYALAYAYFLIGMYNIQFGPPENDSSQSKEKTKDKETITLEKEIISIYNGKNEAGLRLFIKDNIEKINREFILGFIRSGSRGDKAAWRNIPFIMAQETNDDNILADVYFEFIQYRHIDNYKSSLVTMNIDVSGKNIETLRKKLLNVFKNKGEKGLREFVKRRAILFNNEVILGLAEFGVKEKKEEWLDIAKIVKDEVYIRKQTRGETWSMPNIDNSFRVEGTKIVWRNRFGKILKSMQDRRDQREKEQFDQWIEKNRKWVRSGEVSRESLSILRLEKAKSSIGLMRLNLLESMDNSRKPGKITWFRKRTDLLNLFSYDRLFQEIGRIPASEMKRKFVAKFYKQFEETALLNLENKYYETAFENVERIRARLFLNELSNDVYKSTNPEIVEKTRNYIARLSDMQKEIYLVDSLGDDKRLAKLKKQYRLLLNEYETFLYDSTPQNGYGSLRYPRSVSLRKLQQTLNNELALYYFIASNRVHVFVISSLDIRVVQLDATGLDVIRNVNRYQLSIRTQNSKNIFKYGQELYQLIFKPLLPQLRGKRNIIIVPDGKLALVPFESFVIDESTPGNPVYLIERFRFKYIQSASVLTMIRKTNEYYGNGNYSGDYTRRYKADKTFRLKERERGKKYLAQKKKKNKKKKNQLKGKFIGFGAPVHDPNVINLPLLKGSGHEVESIAALFEKKRKKSSVVFVNESATEKNAKLKDLINFDYIHFSCHALLKDKFQSLVLTKKQEAGEDGFLTLLEIANCDYNAKLVVLSACQTGAGEVEKGEGVTSLTRAVMKIGTPAVVASLWKVDDTGTKELMIKFYKNILHEKMDKEDALRAAKLEMIKSEQYSSPFFWSAFVMYGE